MRILYFFMFGIFATVAGMTFFPTQSALATISCSVSSTCATGTTTFRISATANGHAERATSTNYTNLVCCDGFTGIGNVCSGTFDVVASLSSTTNAHIEQDGAGSYAQDVCLSGPIGSSIQVGYQDTNCTGYDTTIASISSSTNAQVGNASAYTRKICASGAGPQTLSFSISDNTVGFGTLASANARYATGDTLGSASEVEAHTLQVVTDATNGYSVMVTGTTLIHSGNATYTITAIGGTATASSVGTEQYGIRGTINSGTGSISAPYNTANWAFDTASFPDAFATGLGDSTTTTYGVRYIANIASQTEAGTYSSIVTYVVTATF